MTLQDLSRLLKYAKVPRSKTVESMYPDPRMLIFVPMSHLIVVEAVIDQIRLYGQCIEVVPLTGTEVGENEHMYVKWTGSQSSGNHMCKDNPPADEARRRRMMSASTRNANVVLDVAKVTYIP